MKKAESGEYFAERQPLGSGKGGEGTSMFYLYTVLFEFISMNMYNSVIL